MKRIIALVLALVASTAVGAAVQIPQRNASGGGYDIKGSDGTKTPCAGCIGEVIEVFGGGATYGVTATANVWTDASAMGTITLTVGTYQLCYSVVLDIQNTTAGTGVPIGNVAMYDGTSIITGSLGYSSPYIPATNDVGVQTSQCVTYKVTSGTKTISLQTRCNNNAPSWDTRILGSSITGGLTDPDSNSRLWAVRIY